MLSLPDENTGLPLSGSRLAAISHGSGENRDSQVYQARALFV